MSHNHPGTCFPGNRDCWLEENSDVHREHFLLWRKGQTSNNAEGFRVSLPCVFRGLVVHPPFAPDSVKTYYRCERGYGVVCECQQCNSSCHGYAIADRLRVFDSANCWPEVCGVRFNPSIVRWQDRWLFAFRNRSWESEIWIGELDSSFRPIGKAHKLEFVSHECRNGADDPRFFVHCGQLHVAFVGVERSCGQIVCSMGFAALDDGLGVEDVVFPRYELRNRQEKNWQFFSVDDTLYAVYSIAPHRVLRIDYDTAATAFLTPTKAQWSGGELRGGASPVLVGDRFYSWFHSSVLDNGKPLYNVGVYTFESKPPFRVLELTPHPLLWADRSEETLPKHVVFPCGAARDDVVGDRWIVAGGRDDRLAELWEFNCDDVARSLVSVTPSPGVSGIDVQNQNLVEHVMACSSIDGWSSEVKLLFLAQSYAQLRPLVAVEVGVWRGRVLCLLGRLAAELRHIDALHRLVVGIDPYEHGFQVQGCTDPDHVAWSASVDWERVHAEAVANIRQHCPDTCVLLRCHSAAAAAILAPPVDLMHIDGCHSETQALADVSSFLPLLSAKGILVLDDVNWDSVKPAQRYLQERCELIHDGGTWQAFRRI